MFLVPASDKNHRQLLEALSALAPHSFNRENDCVLPSLFDSFIMGYGCYPILPMGYELGFRFKRFGMTPSIYLLAGFYNSMAGLSRRTYPNVRGPLMPPSWSFINAVCTWNSYL